MSAPVDVDVAIVGAGIAGASLAWWLTRDADAPRVVVLEREGQPGAHSTGRSAAMFMASYGPPMARALTRASRAFYEAPPPGFSDVPLLTPRGVLYLAAPGQETALAALRDELAATGSPIDTLDAAGTLARLPCLRPEQVGGALWEADAADIDVHALHQGFLRGARQAGATLQCNFELRTAQQEGAAWTLFDRAGQRLRARTVVNAAGAWADLVGGLFGAAPIGLQPRRRSAFTFDAPAGVDVSGWPLLAAVDERFYLKPDAGRLLGSPANADPAPPHDVRPEEIDIAMGIAAIEAATTLRIRRPASTWAGLRSFVADGELVIGPDPGCGGLFWLAGQGGYGIQSAAAAGQLAAALLRGRPVPAELSAHGVAAQTMGPGRCRPAPLHNG